MFDIWALHEGKWKLYCTALETWADVLAMLTILPEDWHCDEVKVENRYSDTYARS